MKYKRQLMTGIFALALFTGNSSAFASEDFVPTSKNDQYQNQVQTTNHGTWIIE